MQAHWNLFDPTLGHIRKAIERYASIGLQIHITEIDVSMFGFNDKRTNVKGPIEEVIEKQTERYIEFFNILREYSDVITSVTFWGVADDYTWLNDFPVSRRKNWPFLFDQNQHPKQSFWEVVDINSRGKKIK